MLSRIGKIIIAASFIISLNPYALIFMIPLFLVGVCLVWVKGKKVINKLLWSIIPVLLWFPTLALLTAVESLSAQKFDIT